MSLIVSGAGQAPVPSVSYDNLAHTGSGAVTFYQPVNAAILNTSTSPMTVCYTTNGTTPACTPGSTTGGCSSLDASGAGAIETLLYTVKSGGSGYTMAPYVSIAGGACANASATATIANGSVTAITPAGTCTNLAAQPAITLHEGGGLTFNASAKVAESITFTVQAGGSGYTANPTLALSQTVGGNTLSCSVAATGRTNGTSNSLATVTLTNAALLGACPLFPGNPTVVISGGNGTGATATATISQFVYTGAIGQNPNNALPAPNDTGYYFTSMPGITLTPNAALPGGTCTTFTPTFGASNDGGNIGAPGGVTAVTATGCSGFSDAAPTITVTNPAAVPATNAASVIAVGSNMQLVPTIEASATKLSSIACNAGLSSSPVYTETYTFIQPTPILQFVPTGRPANGATPQVITADGKLNATTVGAGNPSGNATTGGFTDTNIVYSTTATVPNCSGTGTSLAGSTVNLPIPLPDFATSGGVAANGTLSIQAVACEPRRRTRLRTRVSSGNTRSQMSRYRSSRRLPEA